MYMECISFVPLVWDFACTSKTMIIMIMKILIQWFCYLYVLHLWCIKIPQNAQTYMACVPCRTQRSRRWRCFLWDILFMWFLWLFFWPLSTMHFSLRDRKSRVLVPSIASKALTFAPKLNKTKTQGTINLVIFYATHWNSIFVKKP